MHSGWRGMYNTNGYPTHNLPAARMKGTHKTRGGALVRACTRKRRVSVRSR